MKKCEDEKEIYLRLNYLRGLLALIVLLSHIWGYTQISLLVPFNKMVTIAVAAFFFLSGYGMARSFEKKNNYLKSIFGEKIPFLIYMAVMSYIVSALLEWIIGTKVQLGNNAFIPIGIKSLLINTNWYVYELIAFYLLFAIVMKFCPKKYQIPVVFIVSVIAFFILFNAGVVEAYYNSILGFVMGIFCYRSSWLKWIDKKGVLAIAIFGVLMCFSTMFLVNHTTVYFAIIRNMAAIAMIIVVLYFIRMINTKYEVLNYLSKISPELYFYHMPIALIFSWFIKSVWIYALIVTVISFIVAIAMTFIDAKVKKMIRKA